MVRINAQERQQLEELGVLKVVEGKYQGMMICSKRKRKNGKTIYVENGLRDELYKNKKENNNKNG